MPMSEDEAKQIIANIVHILRSPEETRRLIEHVEMRLRELGGNAPTGTSGATTRGSTGSHKD